MESWVILARLKDSLWSPLIPCGVKCAADVWEVPFGRKNSGNSATAIAGNHQLTANHQSSAVRFCSQEFEIKAGISWIKAQVINMAMWHISPGHLEPVRKGQQELGVSFSLEKGLKWSRSEDDEHTGLCYFLFFILMKHWNEKKKHLATWQLKYWEYLQKTTADVAVGCS